MEAPVPVGQAFRGLVLDLITPEDHGALYTLFVGLDEGAVRWRYRGATPPYDEFARALWANVFAHYLVRRVGTGEVIGYVCAYGAQIRDRTCYVSFIAVPEVRGRGSMVMGMGLFIETLYRIAPFRKLYAEATASNLAQYGRAVRSGLFTIEGTYHRHEWLDGRFEDVHVLATYRSTWERHRCRFGFAGPFQSTFD